MKLPNTDLMYVAMAAFVFVASFSLWMGRRDSILIQNNILVQAKSYSYPQRPKLKSNFEPFPAVSAEAVLVSDSVSGVSLYEKNPDRELLPASTTKIVTALVILDTYSPDYVITAPALSVEGQKMGIVAGEKLSVRNLLYGLLVYSANDAAEVFAETYCSEEACGRPAFINAMNAKANSLGLTNTKFTNPVGFDAVGHTSSPRDLVKVSQVAMKDPLFSHIVGTKDITIMSEDASVVHKLTNINALLGEVPGVLGVKTGWTQNAKENLVTYVERDGRKVMMAVLGSSDRFGETRTLIEWVFENYEWEDVVFDGAYLP